MPCSRGQNTRRHCSGNPLPAWDTSCGCCAAARGACASLAAAQRDVVPGAALAEVPKTSENEVVGAVVATNWRGFLLAWPCEDDSLLNVCGQGGCGAANVGAGVRRAISKD